MADLTTAGIPRASGTPNNLGVSTPNLYSLLLIVEWYKKAIIEHVANTLYEGEIKNVGDRITIRGLPDVFIDDYTKNSKFEYPYLEPPSLDLIINKAKMWAMALDNIDAHQFDMDYMSKHAAHAARKLIEQINLEFLSTVYLTADSSNTGQFAGKVTGGTSGGVNLGYTSNPIVWTATSSILNLNKINRVLNEQEVPEEERYVVLAPWMIQMLLDNPQVQAANTTGDAVGSIRDGKVGVVAGLKILPSNQIATTTTGNALGHHCIFGDKYAITFATQITEDRVHDKVIGTFGKFRDGLQVYGYKTIKPEGLGHMFASEIVSGN